MARSGAREIRRATIACVMSCLLAASAHAQDDARAKLAKFVAVGTDLYGRAAKIIAQEPKTDADILGIAMMTGDEWQRDERAFQISFWPMAQAEAGSLPGDVREGVVRIWQFDDFVFGAVGAAYACKNADAHWRLQIAAELLRRARMASEGQPQPGWNPDPDAAPEDHGKCARTP
jgi:hypothetical protein